MFLTKVTIKKILKKILELIFIKKRKKIKSGSIFVEKFQVNKTDDLFI